MRRKGWHLRVVKKVWGKLGLRYAEKALSDYRKLRVGSCWNEGEFLGGGEKKGRGLRPWETLLGVKGAAVGGSLERVPRQHPQEALQQNQSENRRSGTVHPIQSEGCRGGTLWPLGRYSAFAGLASNLPTWNENLLEPSNPITPPPNFSNPPTNHQRPPSHLLGLLNSHQIKHCRCDIAEGAV